jgi:pimeloyl-ACP methyl ester carboxylesterase
MYRARCYTSTSMTAQLHVDDTGSGPVVVLLHSHGLSGRQWRRLAADLVARGMRALAVDLSGQGRSEPWPEPTPFSFQTDIERVAEIVRAVRPAHVVGHSYGGLIALHVGAAVPSALLTLSVFDPVAFGVLDATEDRDALAVLGAIDMSWGPAPEDRERWLRAFVEFWNGRGGWEALRDDARAEFRRVAWVIREGVRSLTEDRTPAARLAGLGMPALLMTGELSPIPARRVVEDLARAWPDARFATIPGVGHLAPVTAATRVNQHVVAMVTQASG